MTSMEALEKLLAMPTSTGRNGIHISAQLRVDAMQLSNYRIGWGAQTMEQAAKHIDELERQLEERMVGDGSNVVEDRERSDQPGHHDEAPGA
jgi:hypothetical protein